MKRTKGRESRSRLRGGLNCNSGVTPMERKKEKLGLGRKSFRT